MQGKGIPDPPTVATCGGCGQPTLCPDEHDLCERCSMVRFDEGARSAAINIAAFTARWVQMNGGSREDWTHVWDDAEDSPHIWGTNCARDTPGPDDDDGEG